MKFHENLKVRINGQLSKIKSFITDWLNETLVDLLEIPTTTTTTTTTTSKLSLSISSLNGSNVAGSSLGFKSAYK